MGRGATGMTCEISAWQAVASVGLRVQRTATDEFLDDWSLCLLIGEIQKKLRVAFKNFKEVTDQPLPPMLKSRT